MNIEIEKLKKAFIEMCEKYHWEVFKDKNIKHIETKKEDEYFETLFNTLENACCIEKDKLASFLSWIVLTRYESNVNKAWSNKIYTVKNLLEYFGYFESKFLYPDKEYKEHNEYHKKWVFNNVNYIHKDFIGSEKKEMINKIKYLQNRCIALLKENKILKENQKPIIIDDFQGDLKEDVYEAVRVVLNENNELVNVETGEIINIPVNKIN